VKNQIDPDALRAQQRGTTDPVGTPNNPSHKVLTVANVITFCRLLLTVAFLFVFVQRTNRYLALSFYVIAAVTDFLDGQVARRTQTVSWVGKMMDPLMDRVLLFTGVLGLILTGELPVWVACFIIGRDLYLFLGGLLLQRYRRRPVDVVYIGKIATALLMFGFSLMLLGIPKVEGLGLVSASWLPGLNATPSCLGIFVVYLGVTCSAIAALSYTRKFFFFKSQAVAAGHQIDREF
jgi:cardiolipin synthase